MKEQTCCFTGHRKIQMEQQKKIALQLKQITEQLILEGYRYFGVGGVLGFDTLAASACFHLDCNIPIFD